MKLLLQKSLYNYYYKKGFLKKRFYKKTFSNQQEKKFGRFEIKSDNVYITNNKQMFVVKFLANSVEHWFKEF